MSNASAAAEPIGLGPNRVDRSERRRRFLDLVWIAATTEFRRRYAESVLGYAWLVLQPLMLFGVLYLVFTRVIRFGGQIPDYAAMLLLNIVFFYFFREATTSAMRSFVARGSIVRSVRVPPLAIPLSAILAVSFIFATNLVVGFGWVIALGVSPRLSWLLLPVLVLYLVALVTVLGIVLAASFARLRDVGMAWLPVLRLLFYASPVVFPFELIPKGFLRDVAAINPLSPLFVELRTWVIDPAAPHWPEAAGSTFATLAPFVSFALICVATFFAYRGTHGRIAERL